MADKQIWQQEKLGADSETLKKVLSIYRDDGTTSRTSADELAEYLNELSDEAVAEMYEEDTDTAVEMFAECFGARKAFWKINTALGFIHKNRLDEIEKLKAEAEKNRQALENARREYIKTVSRIEKEYSVEHYEKEEALEKIRELEIVLARYKADLYDFYAKAGKLPKYEGR